MKILSSALLLAGVSATLLLSDVPETLTVGETYKIEYTLDTKYILTLLLVQKGEAPIAWTPIKTFFEGVKAKPHNGSYEVTVDESWLVDDNGEKYAFWLDGDKSKHGGGYSDISNWFTITKKGSTDGEKLEVQPADADVRELRI